MINKITKYGLLILISFGFQNCKKEESEPVEKGFEITETMLKTTTFATAKIEPLKNEIKFFGKISADKNKLIEVFPMVGGKVEKVYVELGDYVQKGQVLATIRSTEAAGYEKDFEDAVGEVKVAENNLKVAKEMFDGKLNTERDVLLAKNEPISGYIIQKNINQDMQLRSDRSDNIFDVADTKDVWAIANVNESDINLVALGMDASVSTLSNQDKVFKGKIDKIFRIIDPETNAMNVRIVLDNPNSLLVPDSKATIAVSYTENKSMLAIPSNAIVFDNNKNYVMVYKDKKHIETRPVEVYRQLKEVAYITSGLSEGEKVITHNQLLFYDALND